MKQVNIMILALMLIKSAWATDSITWQCMVTDNEGKQWQATSTYQRLAINHAFDACKKGSNMPESCKPATEACENFSHGVSLKPAWKCTALDQMATPWVSNLYPQKDDAALAAKAYCQEKSSAPDSCFVDLLTCVDVHH